MTRHLAILILGYGYTILEDNVKSSPGIMPESRQHFRHKQMTWEGIGIGSCVLADPPPPVQHTGCGIEYSKSGDATY